MHSRHATILVAVSFGRSCVSVSSAMTASAPILSNLSMTTQTGANLSSPTPMALSTLAMTFRELTLMPMSLEVIPMFRKNCTTADRSSTSAVTDGQPTMSMFHW